MIFLIIGGLFFTAVLVYAAIETFRWNRTFKHFREMQKIPDRSPELFRLMLNKINGLQSASMTLFTKIQKLERQVEAPKKGVDDERV